MDVLKKINAASLVESLTASVIILIVFTIAISSFNSIFQNSITRDDSNLRSRLTELKYLAKHGKLETPFYEEGEYWEIEIIKNGEQLEIGIINKSTDETKILNLNYSEK